VVADSAIDPRSFDGILVSTVNPAQVLQRAAALEHRFSMPVLQLWEPTQIILPPPRALNDQTGSGLRKIDRAA
jgi:hypothetical protein